MPGCYIPKRWTIAVLAHFGFQVVYALRVNLSVALLAMVNTTSSTSNTTNHTSMLTNGEQYNWDEQQQGEWNFEIVLKFLNEDL